MRTIRSILLLAPAALVLAACEDSDSPFEAPEAPEPGLETDAAAAIVGERWADGYATSTNAIDARTYTAEPLYAYNRAGGKITFQRPAGSTGRYIVTFAGLSAKLGTKTTVRVTAVPEANIACRPVKGSLAKDKVEVRCSSVQTGAPANTDFTVLVLGKRADRAFALAHQPTAAAYAPAGAGSYNPAGKMQIKRYAQGNYQVLFRGLGAKLGGKGAHIQVNAVGTGNVWCKAAEEWGGNPDLGIYVQCYTTGGMPADTKFNVLVALPSEHLAYTYTNLVGTSSYDADPYWSSNPAGGTARITRVNRGMFNVSFPNVDPRIIDLGNVQVTAIGLYDNAHCGVHLLNNDGARVHCYAANGTPVDVAFTILLGS